MSHNHEPKPRRVAEPVQVYLDSRERGRLEWLAEHLDATKSDVLRRALEVLEQQVMDPAAHPALRIIGIAGDRVHEPSPAYDIAREHDRFLAESEEASWTGAHAGTTKRKRGVKRARTRG